MTAKKSIATLIACIWCIVVLATVPEDRLRKFHQAYAGKWPVTMTYIRDVEWTQYNKHETYRRYHAIAFPDKMREDIDVNAGTSEITINEKEFIIKNFKYKGALRARRDLGNFISIFSYSQKFDSVKNYLTAEGVDLSKGYQTSWKGKKVYVIGAASISDSTSTQIWYEETEMYPVRLIQTYPNERNRYEYRFVMRRTGNIWFPYEMEQYRNARLIYKSVYSEIKLGVTLQPGVFDPDKFGSYIWYDYSTT